MRRDRTAHSRTLPVTYRSSRVTNGTRKESEPSVSSCPSLSLPTPVTSYPFPAVSTPLVGSPHSIPTASKSMM